MPVISDDKLKITINLKENIYFHDGTQFDAKAMKFSIDRFRRIGINKYILGDKINFIETPSKFKLVFNLNKPSSSINALLTSVNLTPISPTFYKDYLSVMKIHLPFMVLLKVNKLMYFYQIQLRIFNVMN